MTSGPDGSEHRVPAASAAPSNKGMNLTSALPRFARWHGRRSQVMPGVRPTMEGLGALRARPVAGALAAVLAATLAAAAPEPPFLEPFGAEELVTIQAAALQGTFRPEMSPHFETPSKVFLSVGRHLDPPEKLMKRIARLPFDVRKQSECVARRTILGVQCVVAAGEAEVWLGDITRVAQDEAELVVAVEAVSCRRRLRREAGVWRMLTAMEFAAPCRVS